MVDTFRNCFVDNVELINFEDIKISGGCLGCLKCSFDNICSYQNEDGFNDFYKSKIAPADAIIFAGAIKDRFLSSRWKLFFDRSFFMTHIPTFVNKQIGYMISGPLRQIPNLREILEGYTECLNANLIGIISDEYTDPGVLDILIEDFAKWTTESMVKHYVQPKTFLSVGGTKIFRDNIWGRFRFIFQADHRFYKKHGTYDFPQYSIKIRMRNAIMMLLTRIPSFKTRLANKMKQALIRPYKNFLK